MRSIVNISMPKQLVEAVEEGVAQGGYASKSEFFRMLVKQWLKRRSRQGSSKYSAGIKVRSLRG
ncbi:MAG: ribbon-helix-helix domain-containing protein [Candidatus Shapirobacteria bacterium]|jgi:Arc/MetJ-type ribon-helix-helix transcriptional regulator